MSNIHLYSVINYRDKDYPIFQSDFISSIQTGCEFSPSLTGSIQDNTGDHISSKNELYGELTAHYWVWKNAPKSDYIGFCHYRRFFDVRYRFFKRRGGHYFGIPHHTFPKRWEKHYADKGRYLAFFKSYDVLLPKPMVFPKPVSSQYHECHGDPQWFVTLFNTAYPSLKEVFHHYFYTNTRLHPTLMFVTSYPVFSRFMTWLFDFLFLLEKEGTAQNRTWNSRDLAFIAERLMGFYFHHVEKNLRIKFLNVDIVTL
jgi:hypothetical protein